MNIEDQFLNRNAIIRMAREAGLFVHKEVQPEIERFAALVAAASASVEREECAKVCEDLDAWDEDDPGSSAAKAIRARGETK